MVTKICIHTSLTCCLSLYGALYRFLFCSLWWQKCNFSCERLTLSTLSFLFPLLPKANERTVCMAAKLISFFFFFSNMFFCVKWPAAECDPQSGGTVAAAAAVPCAHREAWALATASAAAQASSLPLPPASPEGLINGPVYPESKLGCILRYMSALQSCMIGKEVATSALAMSGVPAHLEPLTNFCCSLQSLGWSLLPLGSKCICQDQVYDSKGLFQPK